MKKSYPILGSEPYNFEYFIGEEGDVDYNHAELEQPQEGTKDQGRGTSRNKPRGRRRRATTNLSQHQLASQAKAGTSYSFSGI